MSETDTLKIKSNIIKKNEINTFKELYTASRISYIPKYLIAFFPFYAILIYNGFISSPLALFLLIPIIPVFAAGFLYNTYCDAEKDPKGKNPITSGAITSKSVLTCIFLLIILSIFLFILIYTSTLALLLFLVFILLWFVYSGLGIRFKESLLGPVIATLGFFVLPPAILLAQFNYFNLSIYSLLLGIFFVYIGHEIAHTVNDYDLDKSYNCRTFAVIMGKKRACIVEYILLIIGFTFLLFSLYYFTGNLYLVGLFALIFIISILSTVLNGIHTRFEQNRDLLYVILPYLATSVYIIILGCLILNLPAILTIFIILIYLAD